MVNNYFYREMFVEFNRIKCIYFHKEKLVIDCIEICEKNINLYKTILKNLLKLNVSGEILLLSIVNFVGIWKKEKWKKKVVFANVSKTTLRN